MLILQLSDLHLTPSGPAFGHGDPERDLRSTVDYLLSAPFAPDLAVVTGDISTDGSPASYRAAMAQLERLPGSPPVSPAPAPFILTRNAKRHPEGCLFCTI